MATIRWHGTEYACNIVEERLDGSALVEMLEHGPRFTIGTVVLVKASEITSRDPAPANIGGSLSNLEAGMAAERETLPPVRQVIADGKAAAQENTDEKAPPG